MTRWEYLHVRVELAKGISDPLEFRGSPVYAVINVNDQQLDIKSEPGWSVDEMQNVVVALLNRLGTDGWELVSHAQEKSDSGWIPGPTKFTFS